MKRKNHIVTTDQDKAGFRVLIDGLIHIYVIKEKFLGLQAYKERSCYNIEIIMNGGSMNIFHEYRETWEKVLKALNDIFND